MTSSADKLNKHLIRASQYLSQFNLKMRHKPGKIQYVPDALSRLPIVDMPTRSVEDEDILDLHSYHVSLISMRDEFMQRIIRGYAKETAWSKILDILEKTAIDREPRSLTSSPFYLDNKLIYYQNKRERGRLCLPSSLGKEVFSLAHDQGHR